jgi:hypothetical protein
MAEPECTHRWKTCPVHGRPDGSLPPMRIVVTCIYGGMPLKDGGTWDQSTSDKVTDRVAERLQSVMERLQA